MSVNDQMQSINHLVEENNPNQSKSPSEWLWINYYDGHKEYRSAQKRNSKWATKMGFQRVKEYNRSHLDPLFCKNYHHILKEELGCGNYLWKPYIIQQALSELNDGDYLIFCDSGSKFKYGTNTQLQSFLDQHLIATIDHPRPQYQVTKRDAYVLMNLDTVEYRDYPQRVSGFIGFKKEPLVVNFVNEWLKYCCDIRIISDKPNECGQPNYKGFVRNHHEQTVLSLLCRKYRIPAYGHWDKMVKRHYFLRNQDRPGKPFNQLLKKARIKKPQIKKPLNKNSIKTV
jgi:hypothetical protein